MEPIRALLDPVTWKRFLEEAGLSHRQKAFLHRSQVVVEVVLVEVQVQSEHHANSVDRSTLSSLVRRLLQGTVPGRVVARDRRELLDPQSVEALADFARRRPKSVRLKPLEILRVVTRDNFRCRVCGAAVQAHPRSVMRVAQEGSDEEFVTVCDLCRLDLVRSRTEPDPGEEPG